MTKKDTKGRKLKQNEDQLKDGRYRYRYTDTNGNRKAVYAWKLVTTDKTPQGKKEDLCLREKIKQIEKDMDDNIDTYFANSTVSDLIQQYLNTKVKLANSTRENYKHMFEKNIKNDKLGKMKVSDVKKSDILRYYKYLYSQRKFSIGSIQLYQNLLYPSFQLAVDDNIIRVNPCRNCMKEYIRGSMDSPREALTRDEQNMLLNFVKTDSFYSNHYVLLSVLLGTGIRISEALGLTWDNIDLKKCEMTIDHQIVYRKVDGKFRHYATPTKNKKTRIIPMQKNIIKILQAYRQEQYFLSVSSNIQVDGYKNFVFINRSEKLYTPNSIVRACHGIRDRYNKEEIENAIEENRTPILLPDFTPHVFRHTACTRMAEGGMDVKVLQEIMGHSNISVTMQVYNHVNADRAKTEMDKLEDIIAL